MIVRLKKDWIEFSTFINKCRGFYSINVMSVFQRQLEEARKIIRRCGGTVRTADILKQGVHPRTFYALRDSGQIERVSRGIYRLADLPPLSNPDLTTVALRVPSAVICLISALDFHGITSEIPHEVFVALPRSVHVPTIESIPLRIFWFSGVALSQGIEEHIIDGIPVRMYSPAKTIADCFKFRNKIGVEVAVEGLKFAVERKITTPGEIHRFASMLRVERIIQPYLDMIL